MDKYTIEQLRTKGTKIQFTKPIVVNCKWWATDHDMLKDFSSISGIVSFGSDIRNGKECINIEKKEYSRDGYWQIYISEFERLGMLKMEKPKKFWITGKSHQIDSILKDLIGLGYKEVYKNSERSNEIHLCVNHEDPVELEDYKGLYRAIYKSNSIEYVKFNLPEDYSKALKYAEEAINSPYWEKNKEITHSVGGKFDVKIKDGNIYHKNDNITQFVSEIMEFCNLNGGKVRGFSSYTAKIKEVEFEYTGCQKVVTKLSDWVELWNKYKETIK